MKYLAASVVEFTGALSSSSKYSIIYELLWPLPVDPISALILAERFALICAFAERVYPSSS